MWKSRKVARAFLRLRVASMLAAAAHHRACTPATSPSEADRADSNRGAPQQHGGRVLLPPLAVRSTTVFRSSGAIVVEQPTTTMTRVDAGGQVLEAVSMSDTDSDTDTDTDTITPQEKSLTQLQPLQHLDLDLDAAEAVAA